MTSTLTEPERRRARLVDQLGAAGALAPGWRAAFAAVPRERFARAAYRTTPGSAEIGPILTATIDPAAYLDAVYSDDAIVTQVRDGRATSSSTQPAVMARMLDALDVRDGDRILEIGTGTGYNAALLCHRLGDGQVTSVDIDNQLVDDARIALAGCRYRPALAAVDGLDGYPPAAPYDRIIVTCSTRRVPAAWLAQTRPGGIVLANLSYGVVPLVVAADGSATGIFLPHVAGFIEARPADGPRGWTTQQLFTVTRDGRPETTGPGGDEYRDLTNDQADFWWRLVHPGVAWCGLEISETETAHCLGDAETGSWAHARRDAAGTVTVDQAGPRRLWDELAAALAWWRAAGRPSHDRIRLTVHPDGGHDLSITDDPSGPRTWRLTAAA